MPKLDFYYGNKKVNEDIKNWRDLEIEVIFDDENGEGYIKSGALEFVGDLASKIHAWNDGGLNGGPGIFEAPPFRIEVCGGGQVVFDGGINTAECTTSYECDMIIAPLRSDRINFLNDRASSFRPAFLATLPVNAPGRITQSDYLLVAYVINAPIDYVGIMVSGVSLFMLIKELKSIILQIKSAIEKLIGHVIAAVAAFVPPTTVVGVALAVGLVLVDIIVIVLLVAYAIFIIKAIVELVLMIFDNLIQRVKYKKGMRVRTTFERCCAHLGLGFSSTILTTAPHKDEVIIPRKTAFIEGIGGNKTINLTAVFGFPQSQKDLDDNVNLKTNGLYEGTFADLILLYEERFNAEGRIINNTYHFETKDYWAKFATYTLPNIQRKNADPHTTNACELTANYHISHTVDPSDNNTTDLYEGTEAYMALHPFAVLNKRNILIKGITEKNQNLALAKIKTTLNPVEKLFSHIYNELWNLIGGANGEFAFILKTVAAQLQAIAPMTGGNMPVITFLTFPANPFVARIGMMMLSSDFIGVQKVLIVSAPNIGLIGGGTPVYKLVSNNQYLTSAQYLMDKFHFTNFAIRTLDSKGVVKNDHNQWLIYTDKEIPFCCGDYQAILNNNYCKTYDQKLAKIISIIWKPDRGTARITYRVKEQLTKNLTNNYVIDGK